MDQQSPDSCCWRERLLSSALLQFQKAVEHLKLDTVAGMAWCPGQTLGDYCLTIHIGAAITQQLLSEKISVVIIAASESCWLSQVRHCHLYCSPLSSVKLCTVQACLRKNSDPDHLWGIDQDIEICVDVVTPTMLGLIILLSCANLVHQH